MWAAMLRVASALVISAWFLILSTAQSTPKNYKHPLTDLPPGGDITVVHYFPDHPNKQFPAGSKLYFDVVKPGEEISLEYVFRPDPALPAREYVLSLVLFYEDSQNTFLSTNFYNATVDIKEVDRIVDTDLLMLYATMAAAVGVAGYYGYNYLLSTGWLKKMKTKSRKNESSKPDAADEWLEGTSYDIQRKKKQASLKKSSSKST